MDEFEENYERLDDFHPHNHHADDYGGDYERMG